MGASSSEIGHALHRKGGQNAEQKIGMEIRGEGGNRSETEYEEKSNLPQRTIMGGGAEGREGKKRESGTLFVLGGHLAGILIDSAEGFFGAARRYVGGVGVWGWGAGRLGGDARGCETGEAVGRATTGGGAGAAEALGWVGAGGERYWVLVRRNGIRPEGRGWYCAVVWSGLEGAWRSAPVGGRWAGGNGQGERTMVGWYGSVEWGDSLEVGTADGLDFGWGAGRLVGGMVAGGGRGCVGGFVALMAADY